MILEKYRRHFWYRIMRSASTSSTRRKALSRISFAEVSKTAYIGPNVTITPLGGETPSKKLLKIGERATISPNVTLLCSMHPEAADIPGYSEGKREPIIIRSDVWIGADAVILGGVKIGKKSVVGAGAVVTDDVPSYSVVA